MEERFLYTVYPNKPIRGVLPGNKAINSGKSLSLTKKEVLGCMKFGTVYRRFANEGRNERVTTLNLDRLHNAKFIEPKDWNVDDNSEGSVVEAQTDNRGTVIDTNPEHAVAADKSALEKAQEIQGEIKKIDPEIEKEVETAKKEANVAPDTGILTSVSMNENGTEEAPVQEEVAEEDKIEDESEEDESTDGEDEEEEDDSESSEEAASEDLGVTVNSGNNHNHKKKKRH